MIPGRIAKQCRERWLYQLNPSIKKIRWTLEEDIKVARLYQKLGSRWTEISKKMPGRTDNNIKNRFNQSIKQRMQEGKDLFQCIQEDATVHESSAEGSYNHTEENLPVTSKEPCKLFTIEKVLERNTKPLAKNQAK